MSARPGDAQSVLLARATDPNGIAVHGGTVCWTETAPGRVMKLALDGNPSPRLLATRFLVGDGLPDDRDLVFQDRSTRG